MCSLYHVVLFCNCLNFLLTHPCTVSRPWRTRHTKAIGGTLLVLTAPSGCTVWFVYPILNKFPSLRRGSVCGRVCACAFSSWTICWKQRSCVDTGAFYCKPYTFRGTGHNFFFLFFLLNLVVWHQSQCSSHASEPKNGCEFITNETIYINAKRCVAKPPSGLPADPFDSRRKVVVPQEKESSPPWLLLQTCCLELKPTMVSAVQFIYSCHFSSKQTQTS